MPRLAAILLLSLPLAAQEKYTGPQPPKADVVYLLHATTLVETESLQASEERKKDQVVASIAGASSPAKTPLAEPIFLIKTEKLRADDFQLYRLEVKNGKREITMPADGRRRRDSNRPIYLSRKQLGPGLYRLEANEFLQNGEYCLSPSGSQQVFAFQVY